MTIEDQLELFFRKFRQESSNSNLTPAEALEYINTSRRSEAAETRFYDTQETITAEGAETYWTLKSDFLGLDDIRDAVTCNGYPVIMKPYAEWAEFTSEMQTLIANRVYGTIRGKVFYRFPAAEEGDVMVWNGAAEPPALAAVTGPDVYLDNIQAEVTVLGAVIEALEDAGDTVGEALAAKYARLKKLITPKKGPRLEYPNE